eukprot:s105_g16.t1
MVFERFLTSLDKALQFDPLTELPSDFEKFFINLSRKPGQTLQEHTQDFTHAERRVRTIHKVDLPEKVKAWYFLRRSGLMKEQRLIVLSSVGHDTLDLDTVQKTMNFVIDQDTKLDSGTRWTRSKGSVMYHDDAASTTPWQDEESWDYMNNADNAFYEDDTELWIDDDAGYFDDTDAAHADEQDSEVFDVDEYDSIYARQGRPKSKGKQKGKGKPKGRGWSPPQKGGAKARGRAFFGQGRQICVRCGQAGHQARNCPSQEERKRKLEDQEDLIGMVKNIASVENDTHDTMPDAAVQDGGAASFLGSYAQIRRYLFYLADLDYPMDTIEVFRCKNSFKYCNSEKEIATNCLLLPIFAGHRRRHVLCLTVGGTCPILIGRPLLERLGLTVDYSTRKYKWQGRQWKPITLGHSWPQEREHIDFTKKLSVEFLMNEEPCGEVDTIGMKAETETTDRDITKCTLTPSPMPSPGCDDEDDTNEHPTGASPIYVEDDEETGEKKTEEPNRGEEGFPTEFVYTLHDASMVSDYDRPC